MPLPIFSPSEVADLPEILSLDTAARLAGRTQSWVRTHRAYGPLVPAEIDGRQAVTRASLLRMLDDMRPKPMRQQRPGPRLVIDNG